MSRKTSAINHRPPSFRFRLKDATRAELRNEQAVEAEQQSQIRKAYMRNSVAFNLNQPQTSAKNAETDMGATVGRNIRKIKQTTGTKFHQKRFYSRFCVNECLSTQNRSTHHKSQNLYFSMHFNIEMLKYSIQNIKNWFIQLAKMRLIIGYLLWATDAVTKKEKKSTKNKTNSCWHQISIPSR